MSPANHIPDDDEDEAPLLLTRPSTAPTPHRRGQESSSSGMDTSTDDDVVYVLSGDLEVRALPSGKTKKRRTKGSGDESSSSSVPPVPKLPQNFPSMGPSSGNGMWARAMKYSHKGKGGQEAPPSSSSSSSSNSKGKKTIKNVLGFRGSDMLAANNTTSWTLMEMGMFGSGRRGEFHRATNVGSVAATMTGLGPAPPPVVQLTERMGGLLDADGMEVSDGGGSESSDLSRAVTPTARGGTPSPFMFNPPPIKSATPPPSAPPKDRKDIKAWERELWKIESSSRKRTAKMGPGATSKTPEPAV